jgi:hypothetical protein
MIIHIPVKSSSNEIKRFVVIFIPLQLTLDHIDKRRQDHVRLMNNLPNYTTLTQEIFVSLVFSVTKIITI